MTAKTIADRLAVVEQRPSGFDYLRLLLSIAIVIWHSFYVCYGAGLDRYTQGGPISPLISFLVPSFFALSGFLVTGSLLRVQKLSTFLTLRFLRIIPALGVEITISALLIGPLVTTWALRGYFSSALFFGYFLNIIGEIHFYLPGVFTNNPIKTVNEQLWTIPYEMFSYICLTLLAVVGLVTRPAFFAATVFFFTIWCHNLDIHNNGSLMVVCCFLWGSVLYLFREKIPLNIFLFCLMILIEIIVLMIKIPYIGYLATLPIAYITVYLGTLNPPRKFPITTGDYSYGLYLYSVPIQQALYFFVPECREWYGNLTASLVVSSLCAYLSWNFVELKIMNHRHKVISCVDRMIEKTSVLIKQLKS